MTLVGKLRVLWCVSITGDELWRFFAFKSKDLVIRIIAVLSVFPTLRISYDFPCAINSRIMARYMRERERVRVWTSMVKWCFIKYRSCNFIHLDSCIFQTLPFWIFSKKIVSIYVYLKIINQNNMWQIVYQTMTTVLYNFTFENLTKLNC